jgi:hypothetical protein
MIAKVQRHGHTEALEALLLEVYRPGQLYRHGLPHLIANSRGWGNPGPERSQAIGLDISLLAHWLNEPLARLATTGYQQGVWHCTVRADPRDRPLSDGQWAQIAADILHRTGLAPDGDPQAVRWVAMRHGSDHMHIIATLARQDGTLPQLSSNAALIRNACHDAENRYGLRSTRQAGSTGPQQARPAHPSRLACLDFPVPPGAWLPDATAASRPPTRPSPGRDHSPRPRRG